MFSSPAIMRAPLWPKRKRLSAAGADGVERKECIDFSAVCQSWLYCENRGNGKGNRCALDVGIPADVVGAVVVFTFTIMEINGCSFI